MTSLLVYDLTCPLCEGWGIRTETNVRTRRCSSCDGTGKVARRYGEWRPYEQVKA